MRGATRGQCWISSDVLLFVTSRLRGEQKKSVGGGEPVEQLGYPTWLNGTAVNGCCIATSKQVTFVGISGK